MKKFSEWAKDNNLELPEISENTKRGGIHTPYPSGYVKSQYPDAYFTPGDATGFLDLKNQKQWKDKAPPNEAP